MLPTVIMMRLLLQILLTGCTRGDSTPNQNCSSSTLGKEFIFGIIYPYYFGPSVINLTILAQQAGSFQLTIPFHRTNQTYTIDKAVHIIVPNNISKSGTFKENRGIQITSDVLISVWITTHDNNYQAESYNVFPTPVLGKRYIAETSIPFYHYSGIMVVATEDATNVMIEYEGKFAHFTLDKMAVYQLQSDENKDLTGSYIQSTQPIAVYTSSLMDLSSYDVVTAQMQPIETFSKTYIVSSLVSKTFKLKIVSDKPVVDLIVNKSTSKTMNSNTIIEYTFGAKPVAIKASTPISVVQYIKESPTMIIVPSIDQFVNNYQFVVPYITANFTHHFSITIQTDKQDGLLYNGFPFHKLSNQSVPSPFDTYIVIHMNITEEGVHTMTHRDTSVKFGLLVYGYNGRLGYGFYAGFHLNGSYNCQNGVSTAVTTNSPPDIWTPSKAPSHNATPKPIGHPQACTSAHANVVFILDSSGSIGYAHFVSIKSYVKQVIDILHVGVNKTSIGIISYSDLAQTEISLGTYNTRHLLHTAVDNITVLNGATNTGAALELMRHDGFVNGKPGVSNIAVLITDGISKDKLASVQQARLAKQAGITIVTIGVGYDIDRQELKEIASIDTLKNQSLVYLVDDFNGLKGLGYVVPNVACGASLDSNLNEFTTPIPSNPPAMANCTDKMDNCGAYGDDVCSDYHGWSIFNCPLHCGFCRGAITTTPTPCVDQLDNCNSYGAYICKDLSFFAWVKDNCRKFCGLCGSGAIPTAPPLTTIPTPLKECVNSIDNCNEYGGKSMCTDVATELWANTHCPEYCGFCNIYRIVSDSVGTAHNHSCPNWRLPAQCYLVSYDSSCCSVPFCPVGYIPTVKIPESSYLQGSTVASTCTDTIVNCDQYGGKSMCTDLTYKAWATTHCPEYCGICTDYKFITGIQVSATNKTCPDWRLLKECSMTSYDDGCCPLPSCSSGHVLSVKPPLEKDQL